MSSRRVAKGVIVQTERTVCPSSDERAQKPMVATKACETAKSELTPPSEKAPQNSGRGGNLGGRYRVGQDEDRKRACIGYPHNKSAKVVGGGGADGRNCGSGQRDRCGSFHWNTGRRGFC
ncbi:hypothetical protein EVAR_90507_1 [Eumeta japonica]|uniref:Uncharacterized protein n=1 Tax=Eumeta variegata TaxID=151549 RepID=A0A4C2A8C2_EUMVA|nr:hypothetical protein EVAR_90507_1 [Eumeta japonica]